MYKEFLGAVAVILTFVIFLPYIRSIYQGRTRPHVFSWVIWGAGTFTVFLAQLADNGGIGAWPIGISGIITAYIALLAYRKRGDDRITRSDWLFFFSALSAMPFWFFTNDPLWAVVILTIVDVAGFAPTVRRAFDHPQVERVDFFGLAAVRNLLVILALEHYSLTTILFPAAVGIASLLLVMMILFRRRSLGIRND